jgi:hypothetical protein
MCSTTCAPPWARRSAASDRAHGRRPLVRSSRLRGGRRTASP